MLIDSNFRKNSNNSNSNSRNKTLKFGCTPEALCNTLEPQAHLLAVNYRTLELARSILLRMVKKIELKGKTHDQAVEEAMILIPSIAHYAS